MLFVHTLSVFFLLSDPRQFKSTINIAVGWQAFRISICDFSEFTASSRSTLSTKHKAIARDNRPPSSYIAYTRDDLPATQNISILFVRRCAMCGYVIDTLLAHISAGVLRVHDRRRSPSFRCYTSRNKVDQ